MYSYSISYQKPDNTLGGMCGGKPDLESTRAALLKDAAYYSGIGYTITEATLDWVCDNCRGEGKVKKCRRKSCPHYSPNCFRVCPVCNGQHSHTIENHTPEA